MADVPEIGLGVASTQEFNVQNHKKEGLKMKYTVIKNKNSEEVRLLEGVDTVGLNSQWVVLGQLDITPPKKVVTKEAKRGWTDAYPPELNPGMRSVVFDMPYRAKNVKCTYDIEE